MPLPLIRKLGFVLLLVAVGGMLPLGGAWAVHDCCGHPSDSARTGDAGTESSPSDDDCVCPCCQAETDITLPPGLSIHAGCWRAVESSAAVAVSLFETDIFRPPLA